MATNDSALSSTAQAATAGPSRTRSLDDRLTVLGIRMVYTALTFYFAGYYFSLIYLQMVNENNMWLPKAVHQPALWLGLTEMLCIIVGGIIYFWGQWAGLYRRNFGVLRLALWITFILSAAAFVLHVYELRNHPGFANLQLGGFVSTFMGLETAFTVVIFFATLALLGVAIRASKGLFRDSGIAVDTFGEFYGWMSALAFANFMALYLQPFFHSR